MFSFVCSSPNPSDVVLNRTASGFPAITASSFPSNSTFNICWKAFQDAFYVQIPLASITILSTPSVSNGGSNIVLDYNTAYYLVNITGLTVSDTL